MQEESNFVKFRISRLVCQICFLNSIPPQISSSSFLDVLQYVTILTAVYFILWSRVNSRVLLEADPSKLRKIQDIVSDFLAVSSRTMTLALFAEQKPIWFIGLIIVHIAVYGILQCFLREDILVLCLPANSSIKKFTLSILDLCGAIGSLFNIFMVDYGHNNKDKQYIIYTVYWLLTLGETAAMITYWYTKTSNKLWYHDYAIAYVIEAFVLSFIVKSPHYIWKGTRDEERRPLLGGANPSAPDPLGQSGSSYRPRSTSW